MKFMTVRLNPADLVPVEQSEQPEGEDSVDAGIQ